MFRKLQDKLSAVAASAAIAVAGITTSTTGTGTGTSEQYSNKIQQLVSMGFTYNQSKQALDATNGNIDTATEILLSSTSTAIPTTTIPNYQQQQQQQQQFSSNDDENEMLNRALQESYDMEQEKRRQNDIPVVRTEAMIKAAQAAEQRYNVSNTNSKPKKKSPPPTSATATILKQPPSSIVSTTGTSNSKTLTITHPDVKLIPKLQDKTKEEQILRNVDRMKCYPNTVDFLHKILHLMLTNNNESKYRTIDKNSLSYQRFIVNVPGAEALLYTMNYTNNNEYLYSHNNSTNKDLLILNECMMDIGLLYLGVSALEQIQYHTDYIEAKQIQNFIKEINTIINNISSSSSDKKLALKCSHYMSQCPTQPNENRSGTYIQIQFYTGTNKLLFSDDKKPVPAATSKKVKTPPSSLNSSSIGISDNDSLPTLRRRFDGDDTIQDVLNFIGSFGGCQLYNRLVGIVPTTTTGGNATTSTTTTAEDIQQEDEPIQYVLLNRNKHPIQLIDVTKSSIRNSTLQYMECWPSGKLEIRPKSLFIIGK